MSECEREGCKNESEFSVGTAENNIHLCYECSIHPDYKRLKRRVLLKQTKEKTLGNDEDREEIHSTEASWA